ncbi:hypothetical protein BKA64DRAFT_155806 [Cadophora sp. MPI-SDFR-AT-0126]|nr:hypothetical protein BKA64DRAFT_155806 [Leotiomycetes sp. MPI-SDFR-AT-0126]
MPTPPRKRPRKETCLTCFLKQAESCNYGTIPSWCRQCNSPDAVRLGPYRSLFSQVPLAYANCLLQAKKQCPLRTHPSNHLVVEFHIPYIEIGAGVHELKLSSDFLSSDMSLRGQMDRIVGTIYSSPIPQKSPTNKLVMAALTLRSYLWAFSNIFFLPQLVHHFESKNDAETEMGNNLCIQISYFMLTRVDEILSEIFAACSREVKAETDEYWGSVTASVAIACTGMAGLRRDLGTKSTKRFYGVEESRELVSHLQYQIQTSTELLLILLRERNIGCDREWHAYFDDTSSLHTVPHFPKLNMTLRNSRPCEYNAEPILGFD